MSSRQQGGNEQPSSGSMAGLGGWERHTKGIGSKLMQKMGYKPGEGLGKNSDGRIDPVKLEANKGRSMLGANTNASTLKTRRKDEEDRDDDEEDDDEFLERGRRRRRRRTKFETDDSSDEDVAKFESDKSGEEEEEEEEDEDSPEFVAKCLLASNKSMIHKLKEECQSERAKKSMLEQTMADHQRELRLSQDIIENYRGVLKIINDLETIYRNDKLIMSDFWQLLTSSISPASRSHLIQIFALPLLKKQYRKIVIRAQQWASSSDSSDTLDLELETYLFKDMIDVAREWLKTKSGYPALIEWYTEWKTILQMDKPEASKRRRHFRRRLLDVMHLATIKNERDLNSFRYVPYQDSESFAREHESTGQAESRYRDEHASSQREHDDSRQPMNFKQLIEQRASDQGLLFRPVSGRNHDSKQVYKLEHLTLYIDNKIIFVRKGDRWQPQTLEDVINSCS